MNLSHALIATLLIASYGCGGKEGTPSSAINEGENKQLLADTESETSAIDTEISVLLDRKTELMSDMSNLERFASEINNYDLFIYSKVGHFSDALVVCSKPNFKNSNESKTGVFDNAGCVAKVPLTIEDSDPNEITYSCDILDTNKIVLKSFKQTLMKSYVVSGIKPISTIIGASRADTLVFTKGSYLLMGGLDRKISVNKLISDGGTIATFLSNDVDSTSDNSNGESGGSIKLMAKESIGKLNVELRGKNAGKQTFIHPVPGPRKADKSLNARCSNPKNCNGRNGKPGEDGKTGKAGYKGGDSGSINFIGIADQDFELIISYFPGKGSAGGAGGEGGAGGPGGKGDKYSMLVPCGQDGMANCFININGKDGQPGPPGRKGADGKRGADGMNLLSLYNIADVKETVGDGIKGGESWSSKTKYFIRENSF